MKNKQLIIEQRQELAEGLKEFVNLINDDKLELSNEITEFLYGGLAMIRTMDWVLDDSELGFTEYSTLTSEEISKEFNFNILAK